MTYLRMRKRIQDLETMPNHINYPEEVFNKKPWTFSYLDELYAESVNGARSQSSLKHLKRVCNTLYGARAAMLLLIIIGIIAFVLRKR